MFIPKEAIENSITRSRKEQLQLQENQVIHPEIINSILKQAQIPKIIK